MARNLETGIKRMVAAKLRERGLSELSANAMADRNATQALQFFNSQLQSKTTESAYDAAFDALAQWAAKLKI